MDTEWKIGESNKFNNSNFTDEPVVFESIVPPSPVWVWGLWQLDRYHPPLSVVWPTQMEAVL